MEKCMITLNDSLEYLQQLKPEMSGDDALEEKKRRGRACPEQGYDTISVILYIS